MARSRNIKPGFFTNDALSELPALTRLMFIGIWTLADREGRLEDRPKKIKAECMPYDEIDADKAIADLVQAGFMHRYESGGVKCLQVVTWGKHQNPHVKEQASTLPAPDMHGASTVQAPDKPDECTEVAGLIPDSLLLIPKEGARKRARPVDISAIELPSWLDRDDWALWVEDRKARRKPITELAAAMQIAKLDEYRQQGHGPRSVIAHSVAGGYQGLFPPSKPMGQQPVSATTPCTDRRGDDFLTQQAERAKEATKPPAALKALLGGRATA